MKLSNMVARAMQRNEMAGVVDAHRYPLNPDRYTEWSL